LNTRDLQAFVAVVESGSMVRASEKLFLTQPGLTRRVQNLETMLGIELLDRQSKPLKPTAAGNEVYGLARTVLRAVDDLMSVASPDSEPTGEFKIGVPPFLSELALEQPIDRLRSAFPNLTLRVTAGWSPGLLQIVEQAKVDAAVVLLPESVPLPEGLTSTLLAYKPTVVVEAFGSELQLSLVTRGLGVGLATPEVLARSPHREALQVIDVQDFRNGLNVWLVHGALPGRLVRPVELMRDALVEKLEKDAACLALAHSVG